MLVTGKDIDGHAETLLLGIKGKVDRKTFMGNLHSWGTDSERQKGEEFYQFFVKNTVCRPVPLSAGIDYFKGRESFVSGANRVLNENPERLSLYPNVYFASEGGYNQYFLFSKVKLPKLTCITNPQKLWLEKDIKLKKFDAKLKRHSIKQQKIELAERAARAKQRVRSGKTFTIKDIDPEDFWNYEPESKADFVSNYRDIDEGEQKWKLLKLGDIIVGELFGDGDEKAAYKYIRNSKYYLTHPYIYSNDDADFAVLFSKVKYPGSIKIPKI